VIRLLAADLMVTLGPGWMAALYLFYFKDSRGFDTAAANLLLLIYVAAGFAGAPLGSGLIDHSQKMTVAARAMADMKVCAHRSYRVWMRRQSLRRPNMFSILWRWR
jgi:predicted MFS family arabinose efflux permease